MTYNLVELEALYGKHWQPNYGSIAKDEVLFVQDLIETHKPKHFLEIGMASGLSGGILANILEANGAESFTTIDHDNTFFGDTTKKNGFLIDQIFNGGDLAVIKKPFTTSLDLAALGVHFDMAFIDANHQQPWPMIDTLCLYPYLTGPKIIVHHDYCLFRNQDIVYGIGPKYLFDQFSEAERIISTANEGNIFGIRLEDTTRESLEAAAINCFYLPWSLRHPLQPNLVSRIVGTFKEHYSPALCTAFEKGIAKFNNLERLRVGV
ncbi:MAG: class I SAM-dependent methyltransferase [Pseudomonadota bacterium]